MSETKDIIMFSADQMQEFLMSFDIVMSDIDGVIWDLNKPVKGAPESLEKLQNLGKQVYLITNNTTKTVEKYCNDMRHAGFNTTTDNIINPTKAIIWNLKKVNFRGEAFAIVSDVARQYLTEAGIQLVEQPKVINTDIIATLKQVLDRPSVKAVIVDFSANCNWSMLALAISCLKRKDVLYLTGATDRWLLIQSSPLIKILGPGPLMDLISTMSERKPSECGKPSQNLNNFLVEKCNVTNPQRCLFIGDTANQDMKFATLCGFKKLLVGSGFSTLEQAQKEDDTFPDYYLPSLGHLFSSL
ncbi:hypothetical protein PUN28_003462 [Cardiocondyla obscurior]|uniref:4-nitrophenylphosphatase n=1 Tax=Cardiocondyla obscurior TaxID=286306 RepID=A0AAW2GMS6_9HYME